MEPRPVPDAAQRWSGAALMVVLLVSVGVALVLSSPSTGMVLVAVGLLALPVLVVVTIWLVSRRNRDGAQPQ
ncbi:hypothetical protein ACI78T_16650 [Blastococcus sp. SYSU D00922]